MKENKQIIVLGGKGFVGSAIVAGGLERGLSTLNVDLDNYNDMIGTSCDVLINANGNSRKYLATEDPVKDFELSVLSVTRSLQDFKPNKYVYLSSIDVYPNVSDPKKNRETAGIDYEKISPYGFHKYLAEQLVQHFAPKWVILRLAGLVGNGLWKNSIYDMLKEKPLRVHPDSEYQYLNTRDFARILFGFIDKKIENEIFNIAGKGVIRLSEIADMIPGYTMPIKAQNNRLERYEVNIAKIKALCKIPETKTTINIYLQKFVEGKITLK